MSFNNIEDEEEAGFFRRFRIPIAIGVLAAGGVAVFGSKMSSSHGSAPHKAPEVTMVRLAPLPPPPPPPPPPPQVQPEQKMIEQTSIDQQEEKPDDKPEPPSAPLTTNLAAGNGAADGFGLAGGKGGNLLGGNRGKGSGTRWGWYAGQVQRQVGEALRNNRQTRNTGFQKDMRLWLDLTGRVTRAQLSGSTGDASLDNVIKDQVLTGLQLQEPPPQGMPMPIVIRVTAKRPI